MNNGEIIDGVLLDDVSLSLPEFARACDVEIQWVIAHVEAEYLGGKWTEVSAWRFSSADLTRARRLAAMERCFDVNQEAAAFMVDMIEEVTQLRASLKKIGAG